MELAGFLVELGDGFGIELSSFGCVDEVGEICQCDICDGFGDVFEVDLSKKLVEAVWKSETVGGHVDVVWFEDVDAVVWYLI